MNTENKNTRTIGPVTGASTAGGALALIIAWVLSLNGVEVPELVLGAMVTLLTLLGGWLVKPGTGKRVNS